jgi:UDP-2,3-diacylglucosamine hydrolase
MDDYFQKELIFQYMTIKNILGDKLLIGHGDGKGPGDMGYKRMKSIYKSVF